MHGFGRDLYGAVVVHETVRLDISVKVIFVKCCLGRACLAACKQDVAKVTRKVVTWRWEPSLWLWGNRELSYGTQCLGLTAGPLIVQPWVARNCFAVH